MSTTVVAQGLLSHTWGYIKTKVETIYRCFVSYNVSVLVGLLMIISLGSSGKVLQLLLLFRYPITLMSFFSLYFCNSAFFLSLSELNPELDGYAKMHWQKWHKMLPNGLTFHDMGDRPLLLKRLEHSKLFENRHFVHLNNWWM